MTWETSPVRPWRRWFARVFDNMLIGTGCFLVLGVLIAALFGPVHSDKILSSDLFTNQFLASMLGVFLVIVPLAVLIGATGSTPGKFLFGIRVRNPNGGTLGFRAALLREVNIWTEALMLGIPIVNLVTMALARSALEKNGRSDWDPPERSVVEYRRLNVVTVTGLIVGGSLFVLTFGLVSVLNKMGSVP